MDCSYMFFLHSIPTLHKAESRLLMKLGWQSFDRICYFLSYGSEAELKDFVANPAEFIKHREDLPIVASDAVPVYLDISTGKVLVPAKVLDASARRQLAKRKGLQPEELTEDIHLVAEGASRQDKDRLTWLCRQNLNHYFKKVKPGVPAVRVAGRMLDSILFVHCSTVIRLEDICPFTDTYLKDQNMVINGKKVDKKKGEKVHPQLLKPWRELRRKRPDLFQQGVRVWGSPNAYQNEPSCSLHTELLEEEFPNGCLHQVDMFSGELTEVVESQNYCRNQVKTIIPPKQTAKAQVTDILFSRIGKAAGNEKKQELRRAQRRKAKEEGVAAKLEAGCFESLSIVIAMHKRCVEAAEEGKVEQCFRKSGYLAYEFGEEGMQKAEGERWNGLPLGGSNLPKKYLDLRFGHVDEKGVPVKPDWSELHEHRRKAREAAADDKRIRAKGTAQAFKPKEGKAALMAQNQKGSDEKAEQALKVEVEELWTEADHCRGVLSEYLPQQSIDEEADEKAERITIDLSVWEGLEESKEDLWMALPPKRRRQIIDEARTEMVTSQGKTQSKADEQEELEAAKMHSKEDRRKGQKAALRAELAAKDKDAVLASLVPRLYTKEERQKAAAERRKQQQKNKPSAKKKKASPSKPSLKFKPSAFAKSSLKRKPSFKNKPSAKKKAQEKSKEKNDRKTAWQSMRRAVERLHKIGDLHGIPRKPGPCLGKSGTAKNLLDSFEGVAESKAESGSSNEAEKAVELLALAKKLEADLETTEKREVAFLEAALEMDKLKAKAKQQGTVRDPDLIHYFFCPCSF